MLKESKADIFVDPVLHTACALDIKHHCAAITPGRGRRKSLFTLALSELPWEEHRLLLRQHLQVLCSLAAAQPQTTSSGGLVDAGTRLLWQNEVRNE